LTKPKVVFCSIILNKHMVMSWIFLELLL